MTVGGSDPGTSDDGDCTMWSTIWSTVPGTLICFSLLSSVVAQAPASEIQAQTKGDKAQKSEEGAHSQGVLAEPVTSSLEDKPTNDPKEILKRAADAAKGLKRFYYEASCKGTGPLAENVPILWGTVILGGRSSTPPEKFRVMVPSTVPGSAGLVVAMAGSDGKTFYLVDVKRETVTESEDRAVISDMAPIVDYLAVPELVHTDPFGEAMRASKVEFNGTEEVNGIPCYVVTVSNADGTRTTQWYFSVRDAYPRKVKRTTKDSQGRTGTTQITLSKVAPNPAMERDPFVKYVPKGYKVVALATKKSTDEPAGDQAQPE
ncbi:MAG: outer membrane lipoprotein carrier protein LolA [Phycisphaerae bacterium]